MQLQVVMMLQVCDSCAVLSVNNTPVCLAGTQYPRNKPASARFPNTCYISHVSQQERRVSGPYFKKSRQLDGSDSSHAHRHAYPKKFEFTLLTW